MNIFTEINSAYYKAAEAVLSLQTEQGEPVTEKKITELIAKHAFKDSGLFIPEKLIPKGDKPSDWGLLKADNAVNGGFVSVLRHKPRQFLTAIQKSWLRAKLSDPKMRLFLDDEQIAELSDFLKDIGPLYDDKLFRRFDIFSDGDNFLDPDYRKIFGLLLAALENKQYITVEYLSGKGGNANVSIVPIAVEYSAKNDKFRIHAVKQTGSGIVMNVGRIVSAELTNETAQSLPTADEYFSRRRCSAPAVVEIKPERNGLERFMLEFASYEKESALDPETGMCRAKIWYDKNDETELLIMLLSFGPVIEIISPKALRQQAAQRALRQYELFFPEGGNNGE
ncbi:MAG: WYL domain-containing protein [Oscillospiraceae bacterium]|nr:WYL domain-containing protein [Oscillospiraceae bacterium]